MSYSEAVASLITCSQGPHPFKATGSYMHHIICYEKVCEIVDWLMRAPTEGVQWLELRSLGGALSERDRFDSAYPHRQELYLIEVNASWKKCGNAWANSE